MKESNAQAEKELLVAILAKLEEHLARAEQLGCTVDWFVSKEHRLTFRSLHKLYASGVSLQIENLLVVAEQEGCLEFTKTLAGEAAFAHDLQVEPLLREVKSWHLIRQTDRTLADYSRWRENAHPAALSRELGKVHETIEAVMRERNPETALPSEIHQQKLARPFTTGYRLLDTMLHGGYRDGTVTLFTAPTKAGKTVLSANLVARAAEHAYGVVVFELEILPKMFQSQIIANMTGIPFDTVVAAAEGAEVPSDIQAQIDSQVEFLNEWVRIYSKTDTIPEMAERIAWHKREWADLPVLVVVDHLNRIRHPALDKKGSGQGLEEVAYDLAGVATIVGQEVPIVLNAQLDDEAARKMKAKGHISETDFKIRGSRAIEHAMSSVIAFCRHPNRDAAASFQSIYDRYKGETYEGVLLYDKNTYRFSDV